MSISVQFCATSTGSNKGTQVDIGVKVHTRLYGLHSIQCALQTFYDLLSLFSKNFTLRLSAGFDHVLVASNDLEYTSYLVNSVPMDNYIFF